MNADQPIATSEDANALLGKLTAPEREYVLYHLLREKIEEDESLDEVPIAGPDGTIIGYIHRPKPPTPEELAIMHDRASRLIPGTGRSMKAMLAAMQASDEGKVKELAAR